MRIKCARCGAVHDSTVTPIKYDVAKDEGQYTKLDWVAEMYARDATGRFECKSCGATNYLCMEWTAYKTAEEELIHANAVFTDQRGRSNG